MSVLRWPCREAVIRAAERYARSLRAAHQEVMAVWLFGSYAESRAGVGSDVDLLIEVSEATLPSWKRPLAYRAPDLPVAEDCIVLTTDEMEEYRCDRPLFRQRILDKMVRLA